MWAVSLVACKYLFVSIPRFRLELPAHVARKSIRRRSTEAWV
jgi:hypothetical protein